MKRSLLPLLACPGPGGGRRCGGSLKAGPADGLALRAAGEELREGGLRCGDCGRVYPILSGVALLHPEPEAYLRSHYDALIRDLDRYGELTPPLRSWLARRCSRDAGGADYGADFRFSQQFEEPWDVARAMAPEPHARYGAFAEWLAGMHGENPYSVLAEWAAALPRRRHLVLDAGCGGGGLLARVAPAFGMALGLDRSFLAVLLARRAVLHLPEAERSYLLVLRRGEEVERPIRVERRDNAEFFVADCSALPLPDELFDAVLSCNVIDIAGIGGPLDEAARVLRPGGSLGVSAPFFFRDGHAPDGDPREAVRSRLRDRGLTLAAEKEGVPWTWATYDRHWHVYFNYCAAAVRE